jgi:hypothetical protein
MGGDSESMTPYMDELRRRGAANKKAKAAAASTAPAAPPSTAPAAPRSNLGPNNLSPMSTDDLARAGLKMAGRGGLLGDRQKSGAVVSSRLVELAKQIQQNVVGFVGFTGFNDNHHNENAKNSLHTKGLALDFVLSQMPSVQQGQQLIKQLRDLGAETVLDEYNFPSKGSTGMHIHAEVPEARYGGIFEGPRTGYAAVMHGREAILPLPNGESIPIAINTEKIIDSFSEALKRTSSSSTSSSSSGADLLSALLDMVRLQRDQNDLVGKLLQAQRA